MPRRVDVCVGQPWIATQREYHAVVTIAHLPGRHVAFARFVARRARSFPLLLPLECFDPWCRQPVVGQASEDAVGATRRGAMEVPRLADESPRQRRPAPSPCRGEQGVERFASARHFVSINSTKWGPRLQTGVNGVCSYFNPPVVCMAEVNAVCVGAGRVKLPSRRPMTYRREPAIRYLIRASHKLARAFAPRLRHFTQHCVRLHWQPCPLLQTAIRCSLVCIDTGCV